MVRIVARRATCVINGNTCVKQYANPTDAHNEIGWYQRIGGLYAPKLIDADPSRGQLVIAAHPVAQANYQPAQQLRELLEAMERDHIHHRDVHPGNIVAAPQGPLLIDWETAIEADAPSYDLHGPEKSGVPIPAIHAALNNGYMMWWGSSHRMSIANVWSPRAPVSPATQQR